MTIVSENLNLIHIQPVSPLSPLMTQMISGPLTSWGNGDERRSDGITKMLVYGQSRVWVGEKVKCCRKTSFYFAVQARSSTVQSINYTEHSSV